MESLRRSKRITRTPKYLEDFDVDLIAALTTGNLPSEVPGNYEEAIKSNNGWKEGVNEELKLFEKNKTWMLVSQPPNVNVISSRWVFTEKVDDKGESKKKARLVARGYQQQALEEEVYAPVARMMTLRVILAIAVEKNLSIHQLDITSAFLKSELKEEVFMYPPDGLETSKPGQVCKLIKALYGLKQSPKCWNSCINNHLLNLGFIRSKVDSCLYYTKHVYLLIWIDDIIMVSDSEVEVESIKKKLMSKVEMRDLSNKKRLVFLGLEIVKNKNKISISQNRLIQNILNRFNMTDCKHSKTPVQSKLDLKKGEVESVPKIPYKELIGSLMYIMLGTRPDLCYAVSYFSRFQNCYNQNHWNQLKNVLRYLKGTENLGLVYYKNGGKLYNNDKMNVSAYVDSDYANDVNDRKSISGYLLKINDKVIYWNSKKQFVVALSSSEAEYVALSSCAMECIFLEQLLSNILEMDVRPIKIYEDDISCIKMAHTYERKRSKHIDVKHHFVRDLVMSKAISLSYIPTDEQIADIFTKALSAPKFIKFRDQMHIENVEDVNLI